MIPQKNILNPGAEVETRLHFRESERELTIERIQDVEDILEKNARQRTEEQRSDWGRHVATIPNVIIEKWLGEEWAKGNPTIRLCGAEMEALIRRKLADPDYAYLRTHKPGTVYVPGGAVK